MLKILKVKKMNKVFIILAMLIAGTLCTSEINKNTKEDNIEQQALDTGGEDGQTPAGDDEED